MPTVLITPDLLQNQICFLCDYNHVTHGYLLLNQPRSLFVAHTIDDVPTVLSQAQLAAQQGHWVAGFIAYEAGGAFGLPVVTPTQNRPLVWMAAFEGAQQAVLPDPMTLSQQAMGKISRLNVDFAQYQKDLEKILQAIGRGETYQVNHTVAANIAPCNPGELFLHLQGLHRFPYGAWLNFGAGMIASFSPELFIAADHDQIVTAPIKGTRPRGADVAEDYRLAKALENSEKDQAEHIMIVDMARNDLGRICAIGTIQGRHVAERRSFSTIHHLETRITGRLRAGIEFPEVMAAMFPAASITGAPKRRTMEIIRECEHRARGVYTGSIGLLAPGGKQWAFNVAIRTVTWWRPEAGEMGLGGGIVADSQMDAEWDELSHKGQFLEAPPQPFGLIETCLVNHAGVIEHLAAHMRRLANSARELGFPYDGDAIAEQLQRQALACHPRPRILRMVLDMGGKPTFTTREFVPPPATIRVTHAPTRLDRLDFTLRHKTTRRTIFDHYLTEARRHGFDDCLFINTLGHVTEGAIRAIAVRFSDGWVVPPLADGLLPSLWRDHFMRSHDVREQSISLQDLEHALEIQMGNAVGGSVKASLFVYPSHNLIHIGLFPSQKIGSDDPSPPHPTEPPDNPESSGDSS
ncbi:MAG: chorismate-binding protein [Magnetococcus sp. THC-1_WYH]